MAGPIFIAWDVVELLHAESLRRFGGSHGVRDRGGIESAIGAAENAFYYDSGDLFDIAAAYAFHIAQAQGFLDGNKRTAVATALAFLEANEINTSDFADQTIYDAMIAIAEKRMNKAELAQLFRGLFQK